MPRTRRGFSDSPGRGYQSPPAAAAAAPAAPPPGRWASRQVTPSGPTERVVRGAGGQLQAIAGREVDGLAAIGQAEADRARGAHQHLVVAVVMAA